MKPASSFLLLLTIWASSFYIKLTSSTNITQQNNIDWYKTCSTTVYTCGNIANISYPFWGGNRPSKCGYPGLNLTCNIDDDNTSTFSMKGLQYHILEVNQPDRTLTLARSDLISNICVSKFVNTTLDYTLFKEALGSKNITILYGCTPPSDYGYGIAGKFNCTVKGTEKTDGYVMTGALGPSGCEASVVVPTMGIYAVELQSEELELDDVVEKGFKVDYVVGGVEGCGDCEESGGTCGYDREKGEVCVCSDGRVEDKTCGSGTSTTLNSAGTDTGGGKNNKVVIGIGIGAGLGVALLLVGSWSLFARRRRPNKSQDVYPAPPYNSSSTRGGLDSTSSGGGYTSTPTTYQSQQSQSMPSYSSSDIEKNTGGTTYFGVRLFTYNELERATNNFDEAKELGDGGFGTVYYGQLPDGQPVAVKRLYENSFRRVEQSFMNEIEILAKLRHDHLVTLYGCTSRHSRDLLLVYEYVPNGTVADHLHGKRASSGSFLSWPIRLAIATETAEALLYLHRSDIIHRDVKTPNILLDDNYRVKVADFGLSRLFPNDVSHVSTAPQGTPGYVDPEYFQCYRLTEKSDVYSFGVVLAELVSSKQAVDITRHRHDINLSNMAVDRIKSGALGELVDERLEFDGDQEVERGVRVVCELAFRCLQQEREMRPSMEEVVEGLTALRLREESFKKKKEENMDLIDVSIEDDQSGQIGSFRNTFV